MAALPLRVHLCNAEQKNFAGWKAAIAAPEERWSRGGGGASQGGVVSEMVNDMVTVDSKK
jgi:hypothetical protein